MSKRIPFPSVYSAKDLDDEQGHDRWLSGQSGILRCEFEVLTPLCIRSLFNPKKEQDPAWIPGSSLRGMVRNMAEALGAGCGRLAEYSGFPSCSAKRACVVCRVFGFADGNEGFASKVRFRDTEPVPGVWDMLKVPFGPRPFHESGSGWILFPHDSKAKFSRGAERCVVDGARFPFRIDLLNLDDEEYSVFRFATELTYGSYDLCHKLGYAKGAGFGSCKIRVLSPKARPVGVEIEKYLNRPDFQKIREARTWRT